MTRESEFGDKKRRALFGANAEKYGDGRPGYPSLVFEHLALLCNLGRGCRVLEIGPGAGQATGPILEAGAEVLAIEVGEEFRSLLQTKFSNFQLVVRLGEFENVDLESGTFDLVAAATSFHWIDPEKGLDQVAHVLKPGGSVALWWNHYGDPNRHDPFREAVQPLLQCYAAEFTDLASGGSGIGAHPYALDVKARTDEIGKTGRFGPVEHIQIPWSVNHSAAEVREFLCSFSHWMNLGTEERAELLQSITDLINTTFDGSVDRPFLTAMYIAQKL